MVRFSEHMDSEYVTLLLTRMLSPSNGLERLTTMSSLLGLSKTGVAAGSSKMQFVNKKTTQRMVLLVKCSFWTSSHETSILSLLTRM